MAAAANDAEALAGVELSFVRARVAAAGRLEEMTPAEWFAARHWLPGKSESDCLASLRARNMPQHARQSDLAYWAAALRLADQQSCLEMPPAQIKGWVPSDQVQTRAATLLAMLRAAPKPV